MLFRSARAARLLGQRQAPGERGDVPGRDRGRLSAADGGRRPGQRRRVCVPGRHVVGVVGSDGWAGITASLYGGRETSHNKINADLGKPGDPGTVALFTFVDKALGK